LEEEHQIELEAFNEEMDKRLVELKERFEDEQKAMIDQQEQEIQTKTQEFNKEYPQQTKNSTEFLNLTKMLEGHVKLKQYTKAHQIQTQLNELAGSENEKWEKKKVEKLNSMLEKLKLKQENEKQFAHKKMNLIFNEFKKNRAIETETIIQKYKNRHKGAESNQRCELNEFHKPMRSAMKNAHYRPNSTQKNATGAGFMN